MLYIPLRLASDTKITVTNTATPLFTLMDTASAELGAQDHYEDQNANALLIQPYDGDIRFFIGTDPTATEGTIIPAGHTWYLPGVELNQVRFIRDVAWDVTVSVVPYLSEKGESPSQVNLPWGAWDYFTGEPIKLYGTANALHTAVQNLPTEYPLPTTQVTTLTPPAAITGFATSDKQLPDNHQVSVSNMIDEVEKGLATSTNQTNNTQTTNIVGVDYVAGKRGVDAMTETLQFIDYAHHEIHGGSHYFVVGVQTLANNNVLDFTWQTPNTAKWVHWIWKLDTSGEVDWYVYENATATNPLANAVTPLNSDRNSANASDTTMKYELHATLVAADADTDVTGATLLKSGISGAGRRTGGTDGRESEIILKQNTLYCLRAVAKAAGFIDFDMEWYEHTSLN